MKKRILIIILMIIPLVTFAQEPELKNMMPNNWEKLTRLTEIEENTFLENDNIKTAVQKNIKENFRNTDNMNYRVYQEEVNGVQFFRLFICNSSFEKVANYEYNDRIINKDEYVELQFPLILQIIFMKGKKNSIQVVTVLPYSKNWVSQGEMEGYRFYDCMIKSLNQKEIGFFITEISNSYYVIWESDQQIDMKFTKCKDQLSGYNTMNFTKWNIKTPLPEKFNEIKIEASNFLFDSKCPLKYSIQNAFDGNPATSYVENTEDDLMKIDVWLGKVVDKMGIINGYAQSEDLYNANNRIRQIENYFELDDNNLEYQFINCKGTNISFTSYYKGNKYNDTCIAEINFIINSKWLFGDINE